MRLGASFHVHHDQQLQLVWPPPHPCGSVTCSMARHDSPLVGPAKLDAAVDKFIGITKVGVLLRRSTAMATGWSCGSLLSSLSGTRHNTRVELHCCPAEGRVRRRQTCGRGGPLRLPTAPPTPIDPRAWTRSGWPATVQAQQPDPWALAV